MQLKTTDSKFLKYGSSFRYTGFLYQKNTKDLQITKSNRQVIYYVNGDIFLSIPSGIATITIGSSHAPDTMQTFILSKTTRINRGFYFYLQALTQTATITVYRDNISDLVAYGCTHALTVTDTSHSFEIEQLYFCSYSIKTAGYRFDTEKHSCWELTYVDEGKLNTHLDGVPFVLESKQYMFYVPYQEHNQFVPEDSNCSYVTIAFETSLHDYQFLRNTVFTCNNELIDIFSFFIHSDDHQRFMNDYLCMKLKELIILTYYLKCGGIHKENTHYYNKLLNSIIDYINENLHEDINVDQICHIFGISRTTIQKIFKNHLKISPKTYIIDTKLSYSKMLLKQKKYTIDEVADMAGFTTANYFSRMFKKHYGISPTKYARLDT